MPLFVKLAGTKAKWKKNSVEYKGTKSVLAEFPDLVQRIVALAVERYGNGK